MRRTVTILLVLCLLVPTILPAVAGADEPAGVRQGRVTADRLNIREGAGTQHPVVGVAGRGEAMVILEEAGDWLRVRLADGRTGWVSARYVETGAPEPGERPADGEAASAPDSARPQARGETGSDRSGGGSFLGSALQWGCLFGAAACAGLAYNEHSLGDDSYEQYKDLVLQEGKSPAEAEFRRQEAIDHDGTATAFAIAGGALLGAFLVQQLFLGGGDEDRAGRAEAGPSVALDLSIRRVRAGVVLARF